MATYNNGSVVQCMRQYEMFANSLNLVKNNEEKNMIIKQLTKLEMKIIELTNEVYEEEYYSLANKECALLDEEKKRITMLIDLINQRLTYVEKRCNDHYQLTGESIDANDVLGANTLDSLENKVKIIDKYSKNIKLKEELENEVKSLSSKISLASEKIGINEKLNIELETKFKNLIGSAIEKCNYYELLDNREEIEYAYQETEKSLTLAEVNYETAKTSPMNILEDCQAMLEDIKKDYTKYKSKISILKLMEIFNREVNDYDELITKRREINDILKYIKDKDFLDMVLDTVSKQYNTIIMEQQDINTYNDLTIEKDRKMEALTEIESENNSEEFQNMLKVLIENEKKRQEKIMEEQRKIEEEEKKRRLEIERKKQEEILKRQKIIEEARKKEIEKRTRELLEQQQNSVLQGKKKETLSFENIKGISNGPVEDASLRDDVMNTENKKEENEILKRENFRKKQENLDKIDLVENIEQNEEVPVVKNKSAIEKELFEEFNEKPIERNKEEKQENKLPEIDIDQYMKNFNENDVDDVDNIFNDDNIFPSIPL
ncbi:MAG: hypothetical protein SOZ11_04490 [Bacilli bacterium]|nr:hypothetical protein [Bacilli bacterium]